MFGDRCVGMTQGSAEADDDSGWRFGVDDVGPEAKNDQEPSEPEPIEPEPISLEHAAFVGVGVMLTLAVMATAL